MSTSLELKLHSWYTVHIHFFDDVCRECKNISAIWCAILKTFKHTKDELVDLVIGYSYKYIFDTFSI